ncbi:MULTISPECIES: ornithine cyclodeaminase family protein [unclassified Streptomyces]|uniref:ornithine cyclodeaminase family protein n=1 Tax=unclassified Streptomyces TaxID=2593676 RepID=UPI001F03CA06|nr:MULTISPECIES: ornithine cyclodeaminase family protein [unclassified Streptomyces]MCH0564864.1 ornithine cyclodeaminase family protein [Streptomyces sp. MUM 2J]MCH0569862.1 ornithine cyclodeaminase family protein [Streptomyces sp. MUM 136J]
MLLLNGDQVRQAFPVAEAYRVMAEVMRRYSAGDVVQPVRTVLGSGRDASLFGVMPCHVTGEDHAGYGLKAVLHAPGNASRGLPTHVGVVMVFDPGTGQPLALMEGAAVTALRTAAASAVATDALARPDAGDLALIGAGTQARSHLLALDGIRPLRRVRVWNRSAARAEEFLKWARSRVDVDIEPASTPAHALHGADLVCTTVDTTDPLVRAADLADGVHVNAVGSSVPGKRELTASAVASCSVFVDSREGALRESSEISAPVEEGLVPAGRPLPEIGEVLLGKHPGRTGPAERTLYKSLGMAAQDVASGFAVLNAARRLGIGTETDFTC